MGLGKVAAAAGLALALGACSQGEGPDQSDPTQFNTEAFCAQNSDPGAADRILADFEAKLQAALERMEVAAGLADEKTVAQVRAELMELLQGWGYTVTDKSVEPGAEYATLAEGCADDIPHTYCGENPLYHYNTPEGVTVEAEKEARGDTVARTLFYVSGQDLTSPTPVQVVLQAGKVTFTGKQKWTDSEGNKPAASGEQLFGTTAVFVGESELYGQSTTIAAETVDRDGDTDSSVITPFDPSWGAYHPAWADSATIDTMYDGTRVAYLGRWGSQGDYDSAMSCDTEGVEATIGGVQDHIQALFDATN